MSEGSGNPVWRNHHTPQFYLERFTNSQTGELTWTWRDPRGQLREEAMSPRSVGFEKHLYSLRSVTEDGPAPDVFEHGVMSPIDNGAAPVLEKLINQGINSLTSEESEWWARFLSSLIKRGQQPLRSRDAAVTEFVRTHMEKFVGLGPDEASHERRRQVEELLPDLVNVGRDSVRLGMAVAINNWDFIEYLKTRSAMVFDLSGRPDLPMITGDAPLVVNAGNEGAVNCLSIALDPSHLYLLWNADEMPNEEVLRAVVLTHSLCILGQCQHIYSRDPLADGRARLRSAASKQLKMSPWLSNRA